VAFWDIYYEHCSYFTKASLAHLFAQEGFDVLDLFTDYDDQYLMIEACPVDGRGDAGQSLGSLQTAVREDVAYFTAEIPRRLAGWRAILDEIQQQGQRAVLWGSGSKGVAFLNKLDVSTEIGYVVDINPNKFGTYMAGTGHEIVGPTFLQDYRPDVVIIMNPIYAPEITAKLTELGLAPRIMTVETPFVAA
jgi:hypothetical protein